MDIQSLGLNSNSPNLPKHKFEEQRENSWIKMIRGVSWNKIKREELETGDHIFTSRGADRKVHHGIYVNDKLVIHFNEEAWSDHSIYPADCFHPLVLSSCIDCFLSGGDLYRFEYGVNPAHFLAKLGIGRTLAFADEAEDVKHRATFLHNDGFLACFRYINNGEDFAIFCKTGLLVVDMINFSRTRQITYFLAVTAAVFFSLHKLTFSFTGLGARFLGLCCICIFAPDIGARPNVIKKFRVDRLPEVDQILEYGGPSFQPIEMFINFVLILVMVGIAFCILSTYWTEYDQIWFGILPKLVLTQAFILLFYWAVLQRRLLSNKIQAKQLRRGDHIYTWRNGFSYAHHGIYVDDGFGREVIHLIRGEDPKIPSSSSPSLSHSSDSSISTGDDGNQPTLPHYCHVEYCSIDSFVDGGELNLYKYGVNFAFFMAKTRGGTCTIVETGGLRGVLKRARFLQKHNRFGAYNLFNNNCEDFAIYCKTGLLSTSLAVIGRNGQIASLLAVIFAIFIPFYAFYGKIIITIFWKRQIPPLFLTKSFDGFRMKVLIAFFQAFFISNFVLAAITTYIIYCIMRFIADFDLHRKRSVPVERLNSQSRLADWFQSNFCHFTLSSL